MSQSSVNHFSEFPFHITGRISNREAFRLDLPQTWELLSEHLYLAHHLNGLRIHFFTLMPNHFHLLASVSETPLCEVMQRFMRDSSRDLNLLTGRINQNWGKRYYRCELPHFHYYMNAYKYVAQNPVRAGLCDFVHEWQYSTLNGLLGLSKLLIPLEEDTLLFEENSLSEAHLRWLNQPIATANLQSMRLALCKAQLKFRKPNGRLHPLEKNLL